MSADLPKFDFVPTPWAKHAACKGMDPNLFQPDVGQPGNEAKQVCNGRKATKRTPGLPVCPVKAECLNYAMGFTKLTGIFGGTNERDRRALRSKMPRSRKVHATTRIEHGTLAGYKAEDRLGLTPCKLCKEARDAEDRRQARRKVPSGYDVKLRQFVTTVTLVHRGQPVDLEKVEEESRDIVMHEWLGSQHGEEADVRSAS